jgi:hypothetical protein
LEYEVGLGRTDTAFDDQVACLFGASDIVREEFCICDVLCVCACAMCALRGYDVCVCCWRDCNKYFGDSSVLFVRVADI